MNDTERENWIMNDEGLYDIFKAWQRQQRRAGLSAARREYIRAHRVEIDAVIANVTMCADLIGVCPVCGGEHDG